MSKLLHAQLLQLLPPPPPPLLQAETTIDFLILNAGVGGVPTLQYTAHGFERTVSPACHYRHVLVPLLILPLPARLQLGTNHMGHAYLVSLLRPRLVAQAAPCRVVVLASIAHRLGGLDLRDLHYKHGRTYTSWGAYAQAKTANILFAKVRLSLRRAAVRVRGSEAVSASVSSPSLLQELAAQLAGTRVTPVSVHPGIIVTSQPKWLTTGLVGAVFRLAFVDKTVEEGAATTLYACLEPSLAEACNRGAYLEDCDVAVPGTAEARDPGGGTGRALWAITEAQLREALDCE